MPTQTEEQQAKDFLKRAEIRTMKKDLRSLREGDALKERDKIAKIQTIEEQQTEKIKKEADRSGMEKVLSANENEEKIAEKDLKNYATEEERQQIFLLESQRLSFEKQIDAIDKEKNPALKLEKNKLLLQKRDVQAKLTSVLEEEKRIEGEQGVVTESAKTSTIASQKKSLEQRRWDIDKDIQEIEKKRWALEKQIQDIDSKITEIDRRSEQITTEKNGLRDKVLGMDKSLRDIYSGVIAKTEERRKGQAQDQITQKEALSKTRTEEKEKIQREQWGGLAVPKKKEFLKSAPASFKEKLAESTAKEEEQRAKFMQNINQIPIPRKK